MTTEEMIKNPKVYSMYRRNEIDGVQEMRHHRIGYALKLGAMYVSGFGPWSGRQTAVRYGVWGLLDFLPWCSHLNSLRWSNGYYCYFLSPWDRALCLSIAYADG